MPAQAFVVVVAWLLVGACGHAQVYEEVFDFGLARTNSLVNKGIGPSSNLLLAADGYFYGTTGGGGISSRGTMFRMSASGELTTLVEFSGTGTTNKGSSPNALVVGNDGDFYGTTSAGGANDMGTVFRVNTAGQVTTLVEFTGNGASNKGSSPEAGLIRDTSGNFYGTTGSGGTLGYGTIFKMTPDGVLTTLVNFSDNGASNKGSYPAAALLQAADGNFYGTTADGGASDQGTVFKMTPSGVLTTLVQFTGNGASNKGEMPYAALCLGPDGNLYGTTVGDTSPSPVGAAGVSDWGSIFKVTPAGVVTTLVQFSRAQRGRLYAGLVLGSDGCFYGTTNAGGANRCGSLFKITAAGVLTTLAEFDGNSITSLGASPWARLLLGSDGSFYGTTRLGGQYQVGTVFKMSPPGDVTTMYDFLGREGAAPDAGGYPETHLVQANDGNFYGSTSSRLGDFGDDILDYGSLFKITPDGVHTTLVSLTNSFSPGQKPNAMVFGNDGRLYGSLQSGGSGSRGTVFRTTTTGDLSVMVNFSGTTGSNKGSTPIGALLLASDGNFYGATAAGGVNNLGTIFKLTHSGVLTTLVEFTGNGAANKGSSPTGSLVQGSDGSFYGTTTSGGASNHGTLFKMTSAGVLTTLVEFTSNGSTNRGSQPNGGLVQAADGLFYGTSCYGGLGYGTLFKVTSTGTLTTLWEFPAPVSGSSSATGALPRAGFTLGPDGNLWGTTSGHGSGTIYRLILPGAPAVLVRDAVVNGLSSAFIQTLVNARGSSTTVTVEYGTNGTTFPNTVPLALNLTGYESRLAGATLTGLAAATTYHYRIRAVNSSGTTLTPVQTFSTLAAPLVTSGTVSDLAPTSARFNGTVNARNYDSSVLFEWGTDGNSFPNSVAATPGTVAGSTVVAVSAPIAGLTKGTTYHYRLVATNMGGTTVSGTQSFRTLTEPTATVAGSFALSTTSVRVEGAVNAQGSSSSVVFEYGTNGVSFPSSVTATPGTVTGSGSTTVSAVLPALSQGTTYHYRIRATNAGGVGTSASASFSMNVLSGFAQVFPGAVPDAQGFVIVNLAPAGLLHGWRFVGEQQWRASGVPAGGLTTGTRDIEFRPVPGHIPPPSETVSIVSGEAATTIARDYYETATTGSGGLRVTLKPDSLASGTAPNRAQWRLLGENDAQWRDSSATLAGLIPGSYLVEVRPVSGHTTPPNANVIISDGQTAVPTITYFLQDAQTGTPPAVLAFESVTGDTTKPYAYVGQIRSNVGSSTGFVVKPRVVATAAHVVWDDGTLTAVQGLQWLFQRHRGLHEPKPVVPRGFYTFDGYAAQRVIDNSPGDSSPQSQHLDVAAIYFNENAGRGGYGGFLASDLASNEFLLSNANKMLVGYPVDGIAATSQGRMHATSPANLVFSTAFGRTFTTEGIRSSGGNSGGPLCVQFENGNYYPAAIYLGGNAQTVVRAIDSEVIDLFNRAEVSSNGGGNNTGGGITHTSVTTIGGVSNPGVLQVIIQPAGAVSAGAAWRLAPEGGYRASGAQKGGLNAGSYVLQLAPVAGYQVPAQQNITVAGGQLSTITYTYAAAMSAQESWRQTHFSSSANSGNGADSFDYDHDGQNNLAEYTAGTNPTSASDHFRAQNPTRGAGAFSLGTAGKAGRSYELQRSATLPAASWTSVATQGPLASDAMVTLTDAASPAGSAFYRIRVTGPPP